MPLHAGDRAPLFTVTDLLGRRVALGDCFGYPTMIALYRAAACPLCNLRLWYLLRRHARFYNYALRLIVFVDSEPRRARTHASSTKSASGTSDHRPRLLSLVHSSW